MGALAICSGPHLARHLPVILGTGQSPQDCREPPAPRACMHRAPAVWPHHGDSTEASGRVTGTRQSPRMQAQRGQQQEEGKEPLSQDEPREPRGAETIDRCCPLPLGHTSLGSKSSSGSFWLAALGGLLHLKSHIFCACT